jgi:hypothetical protein
MSWRHMEEWRYSPIILDLGNRYKWLGTRPSHITSGEIAPSAKSIGGWVGPRAGLDAVEKRKNFPCRESNPGRPGEL